MKPNYKTLFLLIILAIAAYPPAVFAQETEEVSVYDQINWQYGPAVAEMDEWAEIHVPEGFVFAGGDDTRMLMGAMGNLPTNTEVGLFAPFSSPVRTTRMSRSPSTSTATTDAAKTAKYAQAIGQSNRPAAPKRRPPTTAT